MLVFTALTPHSPLLLSSINKERWHEIEDTIQAMKTLEEDLYATHPDTIVLISEHPTMYPDHFSINVHDPYSYDITEFGEFGFKQSHRSDIEFINFLQEHGRGTDHPITLTTDEALSYASAIPLSYLTANLPKTRIVPITFAPNLPAKAHFHFGRMLKEAALESNKRIAIIATGDLSHALHHESPKAFHEDAPQFDKTIQELILQRNTAGLLQMKEDVIRNAQQSVYLQLCMLYGVLDTIPYTPELLAYEHPFGVGYLTAHFRLK